ncbi:hypothetical protein [Flagellimonas meridianipacifica]|uniref:Uncharacterized protein n=1 Tax=Flagellimonas meridianipacifica TaxID=1080225 RepID=A0A2T0MAT0_9FLAO|nr:hypothetical protein [Allomuricauda pacifica]PRX54617.1 hypothetical protein CLV81_3019 [Allomuricauda pacifica]
MKKTKNIKLIFGRPKNGWLPTKFESDGFELEFNASRIPENPTAELAESLILTLKGVESKCEWNLEPEKYVFEFKSIESEFLLSIYKIDGQKNKKLILANSGGFDSIVIPMYRGLKKLNSTDFEKADWSKINEVTLDKLNALVSQRKSQNAY